MSLFIRRCEGNGFLTITKTFNSVLSCSTKPAHDTNTSEKEFRVLELIPKKANIQTKRRKEKIISQPRADTMPVNQDWSSVWPVARTFHPASVPLPLRQGYPAKSGTYPYKYGNAELMKIPNFLHLTPPAIRKHCEALKQFCTQWPEELKTDKDCEQHFPVEYITSDYCYSSPTIREPLARIVSLQVKLSSLKLDTHAKDKILRLLGDRYNPETDTITITSDRCPTKKQNTEYTQYLLTAVYHESWRTEPWEAEKGLVDMEYYDWDRNASRKTLVSIHSWPEIPKNDAYDTIPNVETYKDAVTDLINNGEDTYAVNKYKDAVKKLLNLQ